MSERAREALRKAYKLTPNEARALVMLIGESPSLDQMVERLGCSYDTLRQIMTKLRDKLPSGGIERISHYALSEPARQAALCVIVDDVRENAGQ